MYNQYFGLSEAPFSIAVNPRYLFMSARHRDALAHLLYGVGAGGGFILLTGEVGTGKTTINRCLLEQLPHDTDIAIILNPAMNAMELLATVCDELGISYDADKHTLKTLTDSLHDFLLANHARGRKTVLMIDEAQHLDFDVLEQIRLLTNLETHSEKLLQIILLLGISLPLLAIIRVFGGVPWDYVVSSLCIILTTVIFVSSLSLFFSVFTRKAYSVILVTILTLFVLFALLPYLCGFLWYMATNSWPNPRWTAVIFFANPYGVMTYTTAMMASPMGVPPMTCSLGGSKLSAVTNSISRLTRPPKVTTATSTRLAASGSARSSCR